MLMNKPGINKGGEHMIMLDYWRRFIYVCTPHHKFLKRRKHSHRVINRSKTCSTFNDAVGKRLSKRVEWWLLSGIWLASMSWNGQLFDVLKILGQEGLGGNFTSCYNCSQKECKNTDSHHLKLVYVNVRSMIAIFEQHIVTVKDIQTHQIHTRDIAAWCIHHGNCNTSRGNAQRRSKFYVRGELLKWMWKELSISKLTVL